MWFVPEGEEKMKLILRWAISCVALFVAAWAIPGITVDGNGVVPYILMALILGLVNAFIRPILKLLSCPLILLTLGLFVLVINAGTLLLASEIATRVGVGFHVDGFWPAFLGALIVSVVSVVLGGIARDED